MNWNTAVRTGALALALVASLAVGASSASAATLRGTTEGGNKITLKRSGTKVSKIRTLVPTMCVETTGSGYTRAGGELFRPPGSYTLGRQRKSKALQSAAMNQGIDATKNYTVKVTSAGGRAVSGKLSVSLSFMVPDLYRSLPYIYLCQGTTTFAAS
jgi:hypothetical protein